ncbi:MAG: hypothetical protein AAGE84_31505 [Cyanobacteria bacterium P01_G01_bin.39]
MRFCQELFGFWPNTYAYLHNWIEAYKLFYHCHLISASENIKQVMGIGDKLRLCASCQEGLGDRLRGGLVRFERGDLTIPISLSRDFLAQ